MDTHTRTLRHRGCTGKAFSPHSGERAWILSEPSKIVQSEIKFNYSASSGMSPFGRRQARTEAPPLPTKCSQPRLANAWPSPSTPLMLASSSGASAVSAIPCCLLSHSALLATRNNNDRLPSAAVRLPDRDITSRYRLSAGARYLWTRIGVSLVALQHGWSPGNCACCRTRQPTACIPLVGDCPR